MKTIAALLLFTASTSFSTIQTVRDLTRGELRGVWESLGVRDGFAGRTVFQIKFKTDKEAVFVACSSSLAGSRPDFLGHLVSSDLSDARINLKFAPTDDTKEYTFSSVEIEGVAQISGEDGLIHGKMKLQRRDGKTLEVQVAFDNHLWVHELTDISAAAQKVLNEAPMHR
jgi:hypothetical protein